MNTALAHQNQPPSIHEVGDPVSSSSDFKSSSQSKLPMGGTLVVSALLLLLLGSHLAIPSLDILPALGAMVLGWLCSLAAGRARLVNMSPALSLLAMVVAAFATSLAFGIASEDISSVSNFFAVLSARPEAGVFSFASLFVVATFILLYRVERAREELGTRTTSASIRWGVVLVVLFVTVSALIALLKNGKSVSDSTAIVGTVLIAFFPLALLEIGSFATAWWTGRFRSRGFLVQGEADTRALAETRQVLVDFDSRTPPGSFGVRSFVVLDGALDPLAILSTAWSIFLRSESPVACGLARYARNRGEVLQIIPIHEIREYQGLGYIATIDGAEVSLGSEDFMIERGLELALSDVEVDVAAYEEVWYLALGAHVVARCTLLKPWRADGAQFVEELKDLEVSLELFSAEDSEIVVEAGEVAGLSSGSVLGRAAREVIDARFKADSPTILLANRYTDRELLAAAPYAVVLADPRSFAFELNRGAILAQPDLSLIAEAIGSARVVSFLRRSGPPAIGMISTILAGAVVFAGLSVFWVAPVVALFFGSAVFALCWFEQESV